MIKTSGRQYLIEESIAAFYAVEFTYSNNVNFAKLPAYNSC